MNCLYIASQLKPVFWLVDDDKIDYSGYSVSLTDAERYDCLSVEFEVQSELQGRYNFTKSITIVMNGYQPDLVLQGKRIAVETMEGELYLVNWEFTQIPTYTYSLNNNEGITTYKLETPENLPIMPCDDYTELSAITSDCSYESVGLKTLTLVERRKALYTNCTIDLLETEPIVFDGLKNLSFEENYDGYMYSQTVEFTFPLNELDNTIAYKLQEFPENRYLAVIEPNGIVAGIELGFAVATTIKSDGEEGTITVTLTSDENINCHQCDSITFNPYQDIVWKYVLHTTDNNHYGWVCVDNAPNEDGEAMYIVQEAFYRNGESAHQYKIHEDYQGWYDDLNIVGTFDTQMTFYKDSCYLPDTLKIEGITSPLKFNIVGQRRNIQINSKWSNWVATTVPSFVTLSQERGTSGSTTITMTCTGNTNTQGTLMIANAHNAQSFTIIADFTDAVIVQSTEIDYRAKTLTYWLRRPVYLYRKSSTSGFDAAVVVSGKWVKITYCENQTGQDVVYTFVFKETAYPHKEQTVVITQHAQGA